jgi:hypothetical protein
VKLGSIIRRMEYLLQRAVRLFGDRRYAHLATISVAHLYNLRRARGYQARRRHPSTS